MDRARKSPLFWPVLGSVILHVLFLLLGPFLLPIPDAESSLTDEPARVSLVPIPDDEGQVVDMIDNRVSEMERPDTNYLSDKNRTVDKETQAKITSLQPNQANTSNQQSERSSSSSSKSSEFGERAKEDQNLNLNLPENFLQRDQRESLAMRSPSNYLPEVDIGNETLLNTREFAYQSFYIRMKRQMEGEWRVRRLMNSTPRGRDQYVAQVQIVLDREGRVVDVDLRSSSGDTRFDREAVRTAREAGPYLNPPEGLINPNDQIVIPQWGFIFSYVTAF